MLTSKTLFLEVLEWKRGLVDLHARISKRFKRAEPREQALAYLKGLLSPVERKNGWQIAEWLGDLTPDRVQRLLASAKWDADQVRDDLQSYVKDHLSDPQAVLVLDDTGFPKQGDCSVGVQRQYDPATEQVDNCQVGVFAGYASSGGATFLDRELYLPAEWIIDAQRRCQAGIPASMTFATKPQLARVIIERVRKAGLPFAWVVADSGYGSDPDLRIWLEKEQLPYVLAVRSDEPVGVITAQGIRQMRVADAPTLLAGTDWQSMSMGEGTKGPRAFDWAWLPIEHGGIDDQQHWLLMRRNPTNQTEVTFYLVYGPRGTTLQELVRVVGARWTIEEIFEAAKGEVGLDQYEVRLWTSWYRHITLCLLAHAYLTVMRSHGELCEQTNPWRVAYELLPLTVAEVRHLLWQVAWSRPPPLRSVLAWSVFRRRHQARAKRAHSRRRHLSQTHKSQALGPGRESQDGKSSQVCRKGISCSISQHASFSYLLRIGRFSFYLYPMLEFRQPEVR